MTDRDGFSGNGPDPHRQGTVYRSRPRLMRLGRARPPTAHPPTALDERTQAFPPPPDPGSASYDPYAPQPGHPPQPAYAPQFDHNGQQVGYAPQYPSPGYGPAEAPPRAYPPYPPVGRPRRRRRWPWILALIVVVLVGYPLLLGVLTWTSLNTIAAMPAGGRPPATPGTTFLVVGSDSRQDLTRAERARLGTGQTAGQRTDTIMLLHVPASGGPTVLVSVPRDSYVTIPGHGKNKINAAYAFGGPQLLVRTVEQATGLHVDEYVETGLGGYANLVDAIGGVDVCVKNPINDAKAHITLKAGCQTLDGQKALGYARARYSDPRGDLGRVERQRQVLAAIAGKTLSPSVLLLPWQAFPAGRAGGAALTVDNATTPPDLARFMLAMRAVAGGGGLSLTVPISGNITTAAAGEALRWDTAKAGELFQDLRTDRTAAIAALAAGQRARIPT
ncbi:MAG TPA: LCP family protein [Kineosporiaceae bacterium]